MRALCSILGFHWQDHFTKLEVLARTDSISIEAMLIKVQLRWVDHVIRVADHHLSRQLLYGELEDGKKQQGPPRTRYKDSVKGTASNQRNWRLRLVADVAGVPWRKLLPPSSKAAAVRDSWLPASSVTERLLQR